MGLDVGQTKDCVEFCEQSAVSGKVLIDRAHGVGVSEAAAIRFNRDDLYQLGLISWKLTV